MNKCEKCKFWEQLDGDAGKMLDDGSCHRFPPTIPEIKHGCIDAITWFPCVHKTEWCGEYVKK